MHCIPQNYVLHVNQGKEWKLQAHPLKAYSSVKNRRVSMCFNVFHDVDNERCSLDHPFELSVSACQHPSFELLPASLVLRISHNTHMRWKLHPVAVWQWPFLGLLSLLSLVALFSSFFKIHFTTTATAWRYVARSRRSHASHPSQRQLHRTMTNLPLEQKQLLPTPKPTPSNSISPFPFGEGVAKLWKLGRHNRAWRHCYQQLSEMRFMRL